MQAHYPHQEFGDKTIRGYLFDLERLAVIHGVNVLQTALLNLRIKPGQKFFPHPSEVADEIEEMEHNRRRERESENRGEWRREQERHFWSWVDEQLQLNPDRTEQEILDSVKTIGYSGLKARVQKTEL